MPTFEPTDFYDLDALLTSDERRFETVCVVGWKIASPIVAQHYRAYIPDGPGAKTG